MKISRHADGSYSITGMTRNDLSAISFGMCCAAAFRSTHETTPESGQWAKDQREADSRLNTVMYAVEQSARPGSIVVTSSESYGDRNAFYVEKATGIAGWRDDNGVPQDLTSHLKRKEDS